METATARILNLLNNVFYMEALLILGLCLFRYCVQPEWRRLVDARVVALVLLMPLVFFFGYSLYLVCLYVVLIFTPAARTRIDAAALFAILFTITVEMGSWERLPLVGMVLVSTTLALNAGALLAFVTLRGRKVGGSPSIHLACATIVFLSLLNDARADPDVTNVLRLFTIGAIAWAGGYLLVTSAVRTTADTG